MLDDVCEQTRPFISDYFIEEMQGIADGCGLSLEDVEQQSAVSGARSTVKGLNERIRLQQEQFNDF